MSQGMGQSVHVWERDRDVYLQGGRVVNDPMNRHKVCFSLKFTTALRLHSLGQV